jgi:Cu/Ag efflux pump CusA
MVMVLHLRSALLISGMLPLAVLMAFIAMKLFGVEANVVALAGIAIAIGTIVDMGIIVSKTSSNTWTRPDQGQGRGNEKFPSKTSSTAPLPRSVPRYSPPSPPPSSVSCPCSP